MSPNFLEFFLGLWYLPYQRKVPTTGTGEST